MTNVDAYDLGPNNWEERSVHVAYRPSYAAVVSSSRDPAAVDREMPMPNNVADDDLESDSGFIGNCRRMFGFEREYYHPNNIMPERPWSAVFVVNQTSENSAKEFFF